MVNRKGMAICEVASGTGLMPIRLPELTDAIAMPDTDVFQSPTATLRTVAAIPDRLLGDRCSCARSPKLAAS